MFVIWGYDPSTKTCHGYGPYADQAGADADAAHAKQLWPTWTVVVQAVEPLSAKYPQANPAAWLLWSSTFEVGAASVYHASLSDDPAALDALGAARQAAGAAFGYEVIALEARVA